MYMVSELKDRFCDNPVQTIGLIELLPSKCIKRQIKDTMPASLQETIKFYEDDLPSASMMATEYSIWVRKWHQQQATSEDALPKKLVDVYSSSESLSFPNIVVLLCTALTLPFTSCESERSFSQLKVIKTAHRSTMVPDRLSNLTLIKINREMCEHLQKFEIKELARSFAQQHSRKMKLPYLLSDYCRLVIVIIFNVYVRMYTCPQLRL